MDYKFEVVVLPVADVDRAKAFYQGLGWRLDADFATDPGFRVVQMTPPGSSCSLTPFRLGLAACAARPHPVGDRRPRRRRLGVGERSLRGRRRRDAGLGVPDDARHRPPAERVLRRGRPPEGRHQFPGLRGLPEAEPGAVGTAYKTRQRASGSRRHRDVRGGHLVGHCQARRRRTRQANPQRDRAVLVSASSAQAGGFAAAGGGRA